MPTIDMIFQPRLDQRSTSRPLWKVAKCLTFGLGAVVAVASYRYLFNLPPKIPLIAANAFAAPWLPLHAGGAATALLVGAVQFSGMIRLRRPKIHRQTGRIYLICCLLSGVAGLVLAVGSSAGPIASGGFGTLAILWISVNALGWHRAVSGRWAAHRQWMIRSWALTLSAVTLRLYLAIVGMTGLPFLPCYRAISFLCWVPNLILAEWLLRHKLSTSFRYR